jgi:hypothetical protein
VVVVVGVVATDVPTTLFVAVGRESATPVVGIGIIDESAVEAAVGLIAAAALVGVSVVMFALAFVVAVLTVAGSAAEAMMAAASLVTSPGTTKALELPVGTIVPAPLVITGVGAELIEEFTVICGLVYCEGGMTCPVNICGTACCPPGVGLR